MVFRFFHIYITKMKRTYILMGTAGVISLVVQYIKETRLCFYNSEDGLYIVYLVVMVRSIYQGLKTL